MRTSVALALCLSLGGCAASGPLSSLSYLPPERAGECQGLCQKMGLRMTAVVVIMSNTGCVCEPAAAQAPSAARAGGAAAIGGAIAASRSTQSAAR